MKFILIVETSPGTATTQRFVRISTESGAVVIDGYDATIQKAIRELVSRAINLESAKAEACAK